MDPEELMKIDIQASAKNFFQKNGWRLLLIFVVVLLVHNIFGTHGFVAMHNKKVEIAKVKAELERVNKENASLEQDVTDLKTDPQTIRKIAIEELGLAQPGVVIIKLPAASETPAVKP